MLETVKDDNQKMKLSDNHFLYKLNESLAWILNVEIGKCYNLNESSYFVLSRFDGKKTLGEIRQRYVNKYSKIGLEEPILLKDFNELVERLINKEFIVNE